LIIVSVYLFCAVLYSGLDLQLWGARRNQNVETPVTNNKFSSRAILFLF
jgi:hypothetical protein